MWSIDRCSIVLKQLVLSIMDIKKEFGLKIKTIRLEKNISQEQLANSAEIDRTYISDIEKGERNVSLLIIQKLAKALDKEIFELFK
jgi:transcriptional regulator with XRE-family HTH domain